MNDRVASADLSTSLADVLRPLIAELVDAAVTERLAHLDDGPGDEYLTTTEYARRFKSTPGAVCARIRRGTLHAIRPPGSREWLIPVNDQGYDASQ